LQYNQAFIAIGDGQIVKAMQHRLTDVQLGADAARVLRRIWAKRTGEAHQSRYAAWPDYSDVARLRIKGPPEPEALSESFAPVIFDAVRKLDLRSASEPAQRYALELASIALSMPSGDERALIGELLDLPLPERQKHYLLLALVLSGSVVSANAILSAVREIVVEAKTKTWLLDEHHNELERWIEFFPFSDQPELLFTAFTLLNISVLAPWRLHGLVAAISVAPVKDREALLRKLAVQDPRFYGDDEWLDAIFHCGTEETRPNILDDLADGKLANALKSGNSWRVVRELTNAVRQERSFRDTVRHRLECLPKGAVRSLLIQVIAEVPDLEGIMCLIRTYSADDRRFDGNLRRALEETVLARHYLSLSKTAYEVHSVDASELRDRLFAMTENKGREGLLALECLEAIDDIRDEHGRVDSEPRHPNIATQRSWPQAAKWIACDYEGCTANQAFAASGVTNSR
jgi:hypothetical protein